MSIGFQVSFDAKDPEAVGRFWAAALGYVEEPPPAGYDTWDAFADDVGIPAQERHDYFAVHDPDGLRPRLFFHRVPEAKAGKNRVHLDINAGAGLRGAERRAAISAKVEELLAIGAARVTEFDDPAGHWIVMADPEGNEFCVQ